MLMHNTTRIIAYVSNLTGDSDVSPVIIITQSDGGHIAMKYDCMMSDWIK